MTPTARQEDQKSKPGPERFGDIARRVLADLAAHHPSPEDPMRPTQSMPHPDVPTAPPDAPTALSGGRTGPSCSTADVEEAAAALYRAEWRSADDAGAAQWATGADR